MRRLEDASLVLIPGAISLAQRASLFGQLAKLPDDRWWHVGQSGPDGVALAFADLREGWSLTELMPMGVMVRKTASQWSLRESVNSTNEFVIETQDHDGLVAVLDSMLTGGAA